MQFMRAVRFFDRINKIYKIGAERSASFLPFYPQIAQINADFLE
jgi:hypothetical protein